MDQFVGYLLYKDDKLLLQLRDDKPGIWSPGFWNLPGGRVERGETALEAVIRECREETGYGLRTPHLLTTEIIPVGDKSIERFFFFEEYDEFQPIQCFEGQKVEFYPLSEISSLKFVADHLPIVDVFREKVNAMGKVVDSQGTNEIKSFA